MSSQSIPNEASQLAILKSDASEHDKAVACQKLVYVAGPDSVAPLAALLDHDHLSDYARSGLEAIEAPAASKALLDALPKLNGPRLAGAINSLGVRREQEAVPALQTLATDPAKGVQANALAALGMIATPAAVDTLTAAIKGEEPLRTRAGHAALVAAGHMKGDAAGSLLQSLKTTFPKGPINDAASHLSKTTGN